MGWLNIPDPIPGSTTVISGELDLEELGEVVRRLKEGAALQGVAFTQLSMPQAAQEAKFSTRQSAARPAPVTDSGTSRKAPLAASFDPEALLMDKLDAGLKKARTSSWAQTSATRSSSSQPKSRWKETRRTEWEDHNNEEIQCMAYAPIIDDLPGGDGHGGWLISASKNLLNLWECNVGRSEPSIQLMHSQATNFRMSDLVLERGTQTLMAAARDTTRNEVECLALHSLNAEEGIFAARAQLPLPPVHMAEGIIRANPPEKPQALQAESLHSFGGPMKNCVAASFKNFVTVYPAQASAQPKTTWQAHEGLITQLHRSSYSIDLFTAAMDGSVYRWDLKSKPKAQQPAAKLLGLSGAVTGLHQISSKNLMASSAEGLIVVWDLRRVESPMLMVPTPDGSGITNVAASPEARLAAFSTAAGSVFGLSLEINTDSGYIPQDITSQPLRSPVKALAWNPRSTSLMVASGPSVLAFSPIG